jgi:hypothetical protein
MLHAVFSLTREETRAARVLPLEQGHGATGTGTIAQQPMVALAPATEYSLAVIWTTA